MDIYVFNFQGNLKAFQTDWGYLNNLFLNGSACSLHTDLTFAVGIVVAIEYSVSKTAGVSGERFIATRDESLHCISRDSLEIQCKDMVS